MIPSPGRNWKADCSQISRETPMDPHTMLPSSTTGISYRSEPMRNRDPGLGHEVTGEDISMSSWVYGDPAPPILRAYVGDPSKIRLIHGGIKETHVFHLHNHQWQLEENNSSSKIIDSISDRRCYLPLSSLSRFSRRHVDLVACFRPA